MHWFLFYNNYPPSIMKNLFHKQSHQDSRFVFQNTGPSKKKGFIEKAKELFTRPEKMPETTKDKFKKAYDEVGQKYPNLAKYGAVSFERKDENGEIFFITIFLRETKNKAHSNQYGDWCGGIVKEKKTEKVRCSSFDIHTMGSFRHPGIDFRVLNSNGNYRVIYKDIAKNTEEEELTPQQFEEKILPLFKKRLEEAIEANEKASIDAEKYAVLQEKKALGREVKEGQIEVPKDLRG